MTSNFFKQILIAGFVCILSVTSLAESPIRVHSPWPDEEPLRQKFEAFIQSLDSIRIAKDYPKAIRNLQSTEPQKQILGIRALAASEELETVPWILPFLNSQEAYVQLEAGIAFNHLVSAHSLRRRDRSIDDRVVLLPLTPTDVDLRPLAWVALKMIKSDPEGSSGGYAITMIGYLQLKDFAEGLREIADSDSPRAKEAEHFLQFLTNE
jgi:hypothetical protein